MRLSAPQESRRRARRVCAAAASGAPDSAEEQLGEKPASRKPGAGEATGGGERDDEDGQCGLMVLAARGGRRPKCADTRTASHVIRVT